MSFSPVGFWKDLRRRRVFQVAAIYAASAWVAMQVADVFQGPLGIPDHWLTILSAAVITGFPIAVILAWLFEIGPNGVVRTKPATATGIAAIFVSIVLLGVGTAGLYWLVDPPDDEEADRALAAFEPDPNAVAVLPFVDFSPDKSLGHFAYGIAGVLIDQLSQIRDLRIISDRSSRALPQDLGIREIGRQLNVARLVEGTVQRAGGRLRVTAQLVDTSSGETLWTKRFDPEEADIFAVQDQIALAVADAINVVVAPAVREHLLRPLSDDEAAYELYLRGRASIRETEIRGDFSDGIDYFERSLALDPGLALAWAALSSAVFWHGRNGYMDFEEAIERSWAASNKAIEIDPRLGEAYSHRILLHIVSSGDMDKAREAYERAVEYNPSWPYSYLSYGLLLNGSGLHDEAIAVFRRGLDLQPFKPDPLLRQNLAIAYARSGDYENGMRMQAANYLDHRDTTKEAQYLHWMAATALEAHRFDEAAALLAIGRRSGRDNALARNLAVRAALAMGRFDEAKRHIADTQRLLAEEALGMEGYHPEIPNLDFNKALLYLATNEESLVLTLLREIIGFVEENPVGQIESFRIYDICYWFLALRRYEDAAKWTAELVVNQIDVENLTMAAFAHSKIGKAEMAETFRERAAQALEESLSTMAESQLTWVMASTYFGALGDADKAIKMLEKAYALHYRDLLYLTQMPMYDPLRGDARFSDLLRRIRTDVAEMSRRYEEAAADDDFESLVERHFQPQVAVNLYY